MGCGQRYSLIAYLLNLADLGFTLFALSCGATEWNPIMRNPISMICYKVVVIGVLLYALRRYERWIKFCCLVYGAVCIYHILNLI